jgi:hypothetical protein
LKQQPASTIAHDLVGWLFGWLFGWFASQNFFAVVWPVAAPVKESGNELPPFAMKRATIMIIPLYNALELNRA